jgi:hypothetical protein
MADNTTTYTAVIETKVTGEDEVKGLGDKASETDGKFKSLKSQIRETTVALQKLSDEGKDGTAEFEKLRSKLDDLNDAQDRVNFQAGQFDDQLASLPGPLGQVGGAVKGFNEGLNRLSTSFKVALGVVGLLVGAFLAIKESLSRTEEGQAKLNKITEAFTKIMNGLFAIIEPIAMLFADLVIGLLSSDKAMNALSTAAGVLSATFQTLFNVGKTLVGFIINNFVNAFKVLTEVAGGAGKVLKGVFTFDLDLIKEGVSQVGEGIKNGFKATVDNVKSTVKGIGTGIANGIKDGMEQGSKAFAAGSKRLTEEEKKAAEEAKKKRAEAAKSRADQDKKDADARAKAIAEAGKVETEAYLSTLTQRDQEIFKRGQKLNADLETLEKARVAAVKEAQLKGFTDFSSIDDQYKTSRVNAQQAYKNDEAAINKKYNEEDLKKAEEKQLREKELSQKAFEEFKFSQENRLQELNNRYNREIALVNAKEQLLLCAEGLCKADKDIIIADANERRVELERKKYEDLLALINEEEKKALEVVGLTEAQKTRIALDATAQRQALIQSERDNELLGLETELANITTSFDRKRELIGMKEAELLAQENLTENQRTAIRQAAADERRAIDMAELEARAEIQNAQLDLAAQFGGLLKTLAGENKKVAIAGVVVEQAAAIGKILVNTGIANAKAVAASPLTFGAPWVAINSISAALSIASSIAAGVKAIQQINSAGSGGGSASGGGTIPGKSGAGSAPAVPQIERTAVPQITGTTGQTSPGAQIAGTISQASGKPIKAYVVSGDVTSQQALDRRTTRAATFSGGTNG